MVLSLARILAAPLVLGVYFAAAATGWLALAASGWDGGLLWTGTIAATAAFAVSIACRIWVGRRRANTPEH